MYTFTSVRLRNVICDECGPTHHRLPLKRHSNANDVSLGEPTVVWHYVLARIFGQEVSNQSLKQWVQPEMPSWALFDTGKAWADPEGGNNPSPEKS